MRGKHELIALQRKYKINNLRKSTFIVV